MTSVVSAAADLFLGARCPGCGRQGWGLCPGCRGQLRSELPVPVWRRGIAVPISAAHSYRPLMQRLVPAYKERQALMLTHVLAERLAVAVRALGQPGLLTWVPSTAGAVRARGLDHMSRLTRAVGARLGWASRALLVRTRGVHQRGLARTARVDNVVGKMRARCESRPVLLLDDVVTTGASLREATRALGAAGCTVVAVAVLGHADRVPSPTCEAQGE